MVRPRFPIAADGKRRYRQGHYAATPKIQPFSLTFDPEELTVLRGLAHKRNTSVAVIIRQAIYSSMCRKDPSLVRFIVEREVDSLLDSLDLMLPRGTMASGRPVLKKRLVSTMIGN